MAQFGAWNVGDDEMPQRLRIDRDFLERHLEDWIKNDPTLLGGDIRWVSQQLPFPGYRLDLLGLTKDGTWVIAELKAGPIGAETVLQAMGYFLAIAGISNDAFVSHIRRHGVVDSMVEPKLDDFAAEPEEFNRDYLLLVAGIGDGEAAVTAALTLAEHGFQVPVKAVTFELVRDKSGQRILIREVDDSVQPKGEEPRLPLEALLERASEYGVRDGFDRIRSELGQRGFSAQQRHYGLNYNLNARRNCLWIAPRPGLIHISYLPANFPTLFGVEEDDVATWLGPNELDLPQDEACTRVRVWADAILDLDRSAVTEVIRADAEPPPG